MVFSRKGFHVKIGVSRVSFYLTSGIQSLVQIRDWGRELGLRSDPPPQVAVTEIDTSRSARSSQAAEPICSLLFPHQSAGTQEPRLNPPEHTSQPQSCCSTYRIKFRGSIRRVAAFTRLQLHVKLQPVLLSREATDHTLGSNCYAYIRGYQVLFTQYFLFAPQINSTKNFSTSGLYYSVYTDLIYSWHPWSTIFRCWTVTQGLPYDRRKSRLPPSTESNIYPKCFNVAIKWSYHPNATADPRITQYSSGIISPHFHFKYSNFFLKRSILILELKWNWASLIFCTGSSNKSHVYIVTTGTFRAESLPARGHWDLWL